MPYTSEDRRKNVTEIWANRTPEERLKIRAKMSANRRGKGGRPLSEEHKAKLKASLIGHPVSEETRQKIRNSQPLLGKHLSRAKRKALSIASSGWSHSEAAKAAISAASQANWDDPKYKARVSVSIKRSKTTPEIRKRTSAKSKSVWKLMPLERKKRIVKARASSMGHKQSSWERCVQAILSQIDPGKWLYTGTPSGRCLVGTHTPDFMHKTEKLIIEVDCSYWHRDRSALLRRNRCYRENGFAILCISDKIYSNREHLERKIRAFCKRGEI